MKKTLCVGGATAVAALAVFAGAAAASNGHGHAWGKPPLADATLAGPVDPVVEGTGVAVAFTFTLGSSPATITNGEIELEAPAGWTFTGASLDVSSTCTVTDATVAFSTDAVDVVGVSCATGQTVVLDVTADTPTVTDDTGYEFDSSFKTTAGRRTGSNVFRTPPATVTVSVGV